MAIGDFSLECIACYLTIYKEAQIIDSLLSMKMPLLCLLSQTLDLLLGHPGIPKEVNKRQNQWSFTKLTRLLGCPCCKVNLSL